MLVFEELVLDTVATISAPTVTSTFSLSDGLRCALVSYGPRVAPTRPGALGGAGEYAEVSDVAEVIAIGQTAARCVANAEAIIALLDQAARWWAGEGVEPVQLRGRVQCSTVGDVSAVILGPTPGQEPAVIDPQPDVQLPDGRTVPWGMPLSLQFERRGRWRTAYSTVTSSSAASSGNPAVGTVTLASGPDRSPIFFSSINTNNFLNGVIPPSFYAISGKSDGVQALDLSTRTASGFTTVADAANFPFQGTNILRYTPASTAWARSGNITISPLSGEPPACTFAVFAAVRNSGAQSFLIRPSYDSGSVLGRATEVSAAITTVQVLALGLISVDLRIGLTFNLDVQALSTSGGPTLDLSYIALVNLSRPCTYVWRSTVATSLLFVHSAMHYEYGDTLRSVAGRGITTLPVIIDDREGDADLTMGPTTVYALALAQTGTSQWTIRNSAGTGKANYTYSVTRRAAYRTVQ